VIGRAQCSGVALQVNGKASDAHVQSEASTFRSMVSLSPGPNIVVATCTGSNGSIHASAPVQWNERLRPGPHAAISVTTRGTIVVLNGSHSRPGPPDHAPIVQYAWHRFERAPAALTLASGRPLTGSVAGPRLELRAPARDGEYDVSLTVRDVDGRRSTSSTVFAVRGGMPVAVDPVHSRPPWLGSAVIYAPVPQLWGNGGPRSVERHLPYLHRLGVNVLWLWPPAERRALGEDYRITDYFSLDPSWGPPQAFRAMVARAHALGMHVLIDFVPNHTSTQDPYYLDQKRYGTASHYYDFYDRNAHGQITQYSQIFGTTGLPNLNYGDPEVRRMIVQASLHWIRDYGIDGFRVDAAWGVQRRRPTFWAHWRTVLKQADPDTLLLAEASATTAAIFHGFDLAYDWTNHPGQWAWTSVFDFPKESGALLTPAITNAPQGYAPDARIMRFLNNNDTNPRFVDQYGQALTRVAATLQFTLPGVPEVFAGDEIGASYDPYSNLTPISWRDRSHLLPLYRRLIWLKRHLPTLRSQRVDVLKVNADSAFAYLRPAFDGGPPVLVILNFGKQDPHVVITRTAAVSSAVGAGTMRDLLTNRSIHLSLSGGSMSEAMPAHSMLVLVPGTA